MSSQKSETKRHQYGVSSQEKSWKQIVFILASGFCLLTPVFAQGPAMTAVRDTVYKSDGSLASGTVVITWRPFVTADSKPVFGGTKTVPLSNGALAVALVPNQGGTPSGTSYNVKYYQSGNVFSEETWVVPSSSALPSPGAPTVINVGTPGSTTYYYWVSAKNANGETLLGPSGVTTTSNSTLGGTNYNQISWNAVSGATSYRVWRTTTTTAPSGTGNYLVGETSATSINDQSNSLQQATVPSLNDTDPRTLADVRVTAAPSPTVTLAASQVTGTAIVSNPSNTQSISAPQKAGVIPLQIKGALQDNSNVLEIYDSQSQPALQSYFTPGGEFVTAKAPTFTAMTSGSLMFAGPGGLVSQDNTNLFWGDTAKRFQIGPRSGLANSNDWIIDLAKHSAVAINQGASMSAYTLSGVNEDNTTWASGGLYGAAISTNTSGSKQQIIGVQGEASGYPTGTGSNAIVAGISGFAGRFSGTVDNLISVWAWPAFGSATNKYGLKVDDQTGGTNNWAIKTGAGKVQFGDDVLAPTINSVRYADQFSGADAGAKIAAAIADLPSTGGTVDARGLEGSQTISSTVNVGDASGPKSVRLLLGAAGYTVATAVGFNVARQSQIIGIGAGTVIQSDGNAAGRTLIRAEPANNGEQYMSFEDFELRISVAADVALDASYMSRSNGKNLLIRKVGGSPLGTGYLANSTASSANYRNRWNAMTIENVTNGVDLNASGANGPHSTTFSGLSVLASTNPVAIEAGIANTTFVSPNIETTGGGTGVVNAGTETVFFSPFVESFTTGINNTGPRLRVIGPSWGANTTNISESGAGTSIVESSGGSGGGGDGWSTVGGKYGLGTRTPNARLHVFEEASSGDGQIQVGGASPTITGGQLSYGAVGSGRTSVSDLNNAGGDNNRLSFGFGAVSGGVPVNVAMNITQSGNVGIGLGDAAAATRLDVSGAIRSTMKVVTFSATPTFDASLGNSFKITLTGNVTSSTFSNAQAGQQISFLICQDSTGNRTFVWPTNVKGGVTIGAAPSTCSAQTFLYDGTNAYALSSGVTGM